MAELASRLSSTCFLLRNRANSALFQPPRYNLRTMTASDRSNDPIVPPANPGDRALFAAPAPEPRRSPLPFLLAGASILIALVVIFVLGRQGKQAASGPLPPDPYATNLPISGLAMSESTSLSGGKSTFLDGVVRNTGAKTVTGIIVQVTFANDESMPPQLETLPMSLIRTREPYVDTMPVGNVPIAPGQQREFRLIFENIGDNWNMQMPKITITQVETK
jgi:hypothetical protein